MCLEFPDDLVRILVDGIDAAGATDVDALAFDIRVQFRVDLAAHDRAAALQPGQSHSLVFDLADDLGRVFLDGVDAAGATDVDPLAVGIHIQFLVDLAAHDRTGGLPFRLGSRSVPAVSGLDAAGCGHGESGDDRQCDGVFPLHSSDLSVPCSCTERLSLLRLL